MGGKMSRAKGQRGEREIVRLLQPVVNEVYEVMMHEVPVLKRNSLQSDGGGSDIAGVPWLALEVKYQEKNDTPGTLRVWWQQTLQQAGTEREPVLFYRRNGSPWRVQMYGMLGTEACRFTVPVIITPEDFLRWFRARLVKELS